VKNQTPHELELWEVLKEIKKETLGKKERRKKYQPCQDSNLIWNFSGISRHP